LTDEAEEKAIETLKFVGLYDKSLLRARRLNIAQRKRLELTRALALDPELLLLNEIAAGLNPTEIDELLELLKRTNESGETIIIVEHVMRAVINISQRNNSIDHGEKITEGAPKEIASDERVIEIYLGAKI